MGKIIKNGFQFMEYVNAGLIRKIDDIPELKSELILLSEPKTKRSMSVYALLLAEHILEFSSVERSDEIKECFSIVTKWQNGEVKFQEALNVAGSMNDHARKEADLIKAKAFRAMGQIAATPHVKWHPLVASEYAVVMINLMYPKNLEKVREEREEQIRLMKSI